MQTKMTIEENELVEECTKHVDLYLSERDVKPESKKRFPVDGSSFGYVYQLGWFGIEITVHQFIIFSKYNSRYIDMLDYKNADELLEYALPIVQEYLDDPNISKHLFVRQFVKLKKAFGLQTN